jgi:hypothetical protein
MKMKLIKNDGSMEIYTTTAAEFAALNNINVDEIKLYSDACVGAENLSPDTELTIVVLEGEIWASRSDNPWNEPVDVILGRTANWTYKK